MGSHLPPEDLERLEPATRSAREAQIRELLGLSLWPLDTYADDLEELE